jgi:hypothetical protein
MRLGVGVNVSLGDKHQAQARDARQALKEAPG